MLLQKEAEQTEIVQVDLYVAEKSQTKSIWKATPIKSSMHRDDIMAKNNHLTNKTFPSIFFHFSEIKTEGLS